MHHVHLVNTAGSKPWMTCRDIPVSDRRTMSQWRAAVNSDGPMRRLDMRWRACRSAHMHRNTSRRSAQMRCSTSSRSAHMHRRPAGRCTASVSAAHVGGSATGRSAA